MKVLGVIPARYKSTRLPAKPLADILGKRVVTLETQEGSAYGAALLALAGTGEYGSVPDRWSGLVITTIPPNAFTAAKIRSSSVATTTLSRYTALLAFS